MPIRCFIALRSQDNPDPIGVLAEPVIKSLEIYTFPWVDIQNADFLIVQKTHYKTGELIGAWRGQCGEPFHYQPFQVVSMQMTALGAAATPPTPPPTAQESFIYVNFLNEAHIKIHETITHRAVRGEPLEIPALELDGYVYDHAMLNGVRVDLDTIELTPTAAHYDISFFYIGEKLPTAVKMLINSQFTRANGSIGSGWHLYNNMRIRFIERDNDAIAIEIINGLRFTHDTTFRTINISTFDNATNVSKLVIYPMMEWYQVTEIVGGNIVWLEPYTPTDAERKAYVIPF